MVRRPALKREHRDRRAFRAPFFRRVARQGVLLLPRLKRPGTQRLPDTGMSRSSRSGFLIRLRVMPKPRVLNSENIASMLRRIPWSGTLYSDGAAFMAMIHGSLSTSFVEHANGGEDTCPVKLRVYNAFGYQPGNFPGQRFAALMLQRDGALHAKPTVPACVPTPSDQAGGPAEPISGQQNARAFRQPRANTFQKPVLHTPPDCPFGSAHTPGYRRYQYISRVLSNSRINADEVMCAYAGELFRRLHDRPAGETICLNPGIKFGKTIRYRHDSLRYQQWRLLESHKTAKCQITRRILKGGKIGRPYHPSIYPHLPELVYFGKARERPPDGAQACPEEGTQGSSSFPGSLFSPRCATGCSSFAPVETARYTAIAGTGMSRSSLRFFDPASGDAKAPGFEVGEHCLDAPAHPMVGNPVFGRGCVHGDDPWFPVAFFVEHANGGEDTCPVKLRVYNAFGYQPGNFPGQRFAALMLQRDIALHAKPTVPA